MMQIKRNIPHVHNFAATAAASTVQWIGPDHEVTATAPALVSHGSNRYTVAPIATEYGEWLLAVYDGSSNLIHQERFACVAGTDREVELGMVNSHEALVNLSEDITDVVLWSHYGADYTDAGVDANLAVINEYFGEAG